MRHGIRYMMLALMAVALNTSAQNASAQKDGRLSVWLQQAIRQGANGQRTMGPGQRAASDERRTTVFVQLKEDTDDGTLAQYGCKKFAQLGDIAIVTMPLKWVDSLSRRPEVLRIEANNKAHTTMDQVPAITNLLPLYQQTAEHPAFTGRGVVVGLMDIGFDLTHPTFYNDTTLSDYRIKAFWDQLAPHAESDRLPVGNEWTTTEDVLARQCATDGHEQNHGTHTTGIAAGSGYNSPYRGVAWESDICLVANGVTEDSALIAEADYYLYTTATDALGFKYLFDYADSQQKPCVASFSEGYTPLLNDDDRLYSLFLSRLVGPGHILVSSAGNECQSMTYFQKPRGTEHAGSFVRVFHPTATYHLLTDGTPTIRLIAYAATGGGQVLSELKLPTDSERWQDDQMADTLFLEVRDEKSEVSVRDTCAVSITRYEARLVEGKTVYQIELTGNRSLNRLEHIAMVIEGADCESEVYGSSTDSFGNYGTDVQWNAAEMSHNILSPGCFDAAITVGSTSHRLSYTNVNGDDISDALDPEAGRLSWFSSVGPTMDGRIKPDVTAPGKNVISSLSSYYLETYPNETSYHVKHFEQGGRTYVWGAETGTSMSTPAVAGIIALWLQANPTLTPDDIRRILQRTCQHPDEQLTYPNSRYGYGEVDAYRGLLDILGIDGIKALSHHQPQGVRVTAKDGMLHLSFAQKPTEPVMLSIYATSGALLHKQQLTPDSNDITLPLPVKTSGIYAVQLTSKEQAVSGSQLIRGER